MMMETLSKDNNMNVEKQQASPYASRHSTIGARSFVFDWPAETSPDENAALVQSLPSRVHQLASHYTMNAEKAAMEARSVTISPNGKNDPMESRRIAITAAVVQASPSNVWKCFQILFQGIIQNHIKDNSDDSEDEDMEDEEESEEMDMDFNMEDFFRNIHTLQWLNAVNPARTDILTPILQRALYEQIHKHVSDKISGVYDEDAGDFFESLIQWKNDHLTSLMKKILCYNPDDDASVTLLAKYDLVLDQAISESYCSIRSKEIFDLIADYPDSLPAVIDLHKALSKAHKVSSIVNALKQTFRKRLLHPGAETGQIITVYMNTIKVMRVFDPTDCLLDNVAQDLRNYLKGRSDTVRCIITSLTDDQAESDLYEELKRNDAVPLEEARYDSDDDDEPPDENWTPAPSKYYQRISGSMERRNVDKNADILAMLVRIYGTNDLFVDEYRFMLADKLLANVDFDTDKEVQNLEMLKLRFGEASMRQCEIMIKDMDDSKRIASNINSKQKEEKMEDSGPKVDAAIISHIFWPPLQKDTMKNHPRIQAHLDEFSDEFTTLKKPRKLIWFQQLGSVQLELDVIEADGEITTKEFTCSPLHATLINHFEDKECWTARELSNETGVQEDVVMKRMTYWVNQRVVRLVRSINEVTYELMSNNDVIEHNDDFYDEEDDIIVSMSHQEEEEWETYESLVFGMLSNARQLRLDEIHDRLKVVTRGSEHNYNKSQHQLSAFLQQLCKDEKLECGADGSYKRLVH